MLQNVAEWMALSPYVFSSDGKKRLENVLLLLGETLLGTVVHRHNLAILDLLTQLIGKLNKIPIVFCHWLLQKRKTFMHGNKTADLGSLKSLEPIGLFAHPDKDESP